MPRTGVDGASVYYREWGSAGAPVVLLHGSAGSGAQWEALAAVLSPRFHVVAPDLPGYGRTGDWTGGRTDLTGGAALLDAPALGAPRPVHLVGHSYGGALALRAALDRPERIASLTLIEPVAFHLLGEGGDLGRALHGEIADLAGGFAVRVSAGKRDGAMARFVDFWNGPGAWDRARPETRRDLARRADRVAADFAALMGETAPLAAYGRIAAPTLVLCGQTSHWATYAVAEMLEGALPAARLSIVPGAGHMAPITHPDPVNRAVAAHLEAASAAGRRAA